MDSIQRIARLFGRFFIGIGIRDYRLRLFAYLVMGILFVVWQSIAHASLYKEENTARLFSSGDAVCQYNWTIWHANPVFASATYVGYQEITPTFGVCRTNYNGSISNFVNVTIMSDCPSPQTLQNGVCAAPPSCVSGDKVSSGFYDYGTNIAGTMPQARCDGGCETNFSGSSPAARKLVGGVYHYYAQGSYEKNGQSCSTGSASGAPSSTPPPSTCGTGQTLGQVNGVDTCLTSGGTPANPYVPPPAPSPTLPPAKVESPPVSDGAGGTNQTTVTNNVTNNTTTTTVTNTAADGTKSTTSTTTATNPGSPTGQDPVKDFCAQNPTAPMCKIADICDTRPDIPMCKIGTWGGTCTAFTCDGDAIQCAQAQGIWKANCEYDKLLIPTALSDIGRDVAAGSDSQQGAIDTMKTGTTKDVQAAFTAAQGGRWLGSGDLPNISIPAMGTTFTMDLGLLSNFLRAIGYIFVAVAGVVAIRIVAGANV